MDELIKQLVEGLDRTEEHLEEADQLLERGADDAAVRTSIRSGLAALRTSGEKVRNLLEAIGERRGRGSVSSCGDLESVIEIRARELGREADAEIGGGIGALDPDEIERLSEMVGTALDCVARREADGVLRVEVRVQAGGIVATIEESEGRGGVPDFGGSTKELRDLRESVREAGGEFEVQTSWREGTVLEIRLDGDGAAG